MNPAQANRRTEARPDQHARTPAFLPGSGINLNPEVSL